MDRREGRESDFPFHGGVEQTVPLLAVKLSKGKEDD